MYNVTLTTTLWKSLINGEKFKNASKIQKFNLLGTRNDAYSFAVSRSEQPRSKIRVSGARSEGEPGRAGESPGRDRATWRLVAPAEGSSSRRWGTKKCERGPGTGYARGMAGSWEGEKRKKRRQLTEVWLAECSKVVLLVSGWLHGRREA